MRRRPDFDSGIPGPSVIWSGYRHEGSPVGADTDEPVRFACGSAEALPYQNEFFDMVVARVSLPYVNLPMAFREIRRVLRKGGELWITLHPFAVVWK